MSLNDGNDSPVLYWCSSFQSSLGGQEANMMQRFTIRLDLKTSKPFTTAMKLHDLHM